MCLRGDEKTGGRRERERGKGSKNDTMGERRVEFWDVRGEGKEGKGVPSNGGARIITHGLRRCELPLSMTSTPPLPAAAMTQCLTPKSIPTTDIFIKLQYISPA
jgi:hypothetical protein